MRKKLRVRDGGGWGERFAHLVQEAEAIARPRALYGLAYVEARSERSVVVDGVTLDSRVLRVNLENTHRVFPYLVTCGTELHDWAATQDDIVERIVRADDFADAGFDVGERRGASALQRR